MSKKNLHIKKYLNGKLPEPEVQADDAWAQMNDMLSSDSPTPDSSLPNTNTFNLLLKGGLGIFATLGIVASIWFFLPDNSKKNKAGVPSEKLLQEKNTSQYPTGNSHTENPKNTTANQELPLDSASISLFSTENKTEKDSSISADSQQNKLRAGQNSAGITLPSTDSKTAHFNSKTDKKEIGTRGDYSEPETSKSSSVKFKSRLGTGNKITGKNSGKATRNEDVYPQYSNLTGKSAKTHNRTQRGNTAGDHSDNAVSSGNAQTYNAGKQTVLEISEKPDISIKRIAYSVQNLTSKGVHFNNLGKNLPKRVKYNPAITKQKTNAPKEKKALFETLHVGLDWNVPSALNSTKYIFTATDSTNKPYMLLIPGIWLSKDITENQSLTLSFYANQAYFGGLKRTQRIGADSALFHNNINLIKATGINLSLQYNYRIISTLGVSAGVSYSPLRRALAQDDLENYQGKIIPGSKLVLKKNNIDQYMKTNLFMVKTGLTFTPGRYQFGINLLIPLSNLSITPTSSLNTMNGQFFFRFRIK